MKGQINLAEPAGKVIKEISGRTDVSTIVEIGTLDRDWETIP